MPGETEATDVDRWFGLNVKMAREEANMSQDALAQQMREAGFRFHQQTIGRIEAGLQAARVGEASALARIFDTTVEHMTGMPDITREGWVLRAAARRVRSARAEAAAATRRSREAVDRLDGLIARARSGAHAEALDAEIEAAGLALKED